MAHQATYRSCCCGEAPTAARARGRWRSCPCAAPLGSHAASARRAARSSYAAYAAENAGQVTCALTRTLSVVHRARGRVRVRCATRVGQTGRPRRAWPQFAAPSHLCVHSVTHVCMAYACGASLTCALGCLGGSAALTVHVYASPSNTLNSNIGTTPLLGCNPERNNDVRAAVPRHCAMQCTNVARPTNK